MITDGTGWDGELMRAERPTKTDQQQEARWVALESLRGSHRPSERNWLVDVTLVAITELEHQADVAEALRAENARLRGLLRLVRRQRTPEDLAIIDAPLMRRIVAILDAAPEGKQE